MHQITLPCRRWKRAFPGPFGAKVKWRMSCESTREWVRGLLSLSHGEWVSHNLESPYRLSADPVRLFHGTFLFLSAVDRRIPTMHKMCLWLSQFFRFHWWDVLYTDWRNSICGKPRSPWGVCWWSMHLLYLLRRCKISGAFDDILCIFH